MRRSRETGTAYNASCDQKCFRNVTSNFLTFVLLFSFFNLYFGLSDNKMAMVDVDGSSLPADSQSKLFGLV